MTMTVDTRLVLASLYRRCSYAIRAYPSTGFMDGQREDSKESDELQGTGQKPFGRLDRRIARFLLSFWFSTVDDGYILIGVNGGIFESFLHTDNKILRSLVRPLPSISNRFKCRNGYIRYWPWSTIEAQSLPLRYTPLADSSCPNAVNPATSYHYHCHVF